MYDTFDPKGSYAEEKDDTPAGLAQHMHTYAGLPLHHCHCALALPATCRHAPAPASLQLGGCSREDPSSLALGNLAECIIIVACNSSGGVWACRNAILLCDGRGCSVALHQHCCGVADIPEGDWLCDGCAAGVPPREHRCLLCPVSGGALRKVAGTGPVKLPPGGALFPLSSPSQLLLRLPQLVGRGSRLSIATLAFQLCEGRNKRVRHAQD